MLRNGEIVQNENKEICVWWAVFWKQLLVWDMWTGIMSSNVFSLTGLVLQVAQTRRWVLQFYQNIEQVLWMSESPQGSWRT